MAKGEKRVNSVLSLPLEFSDAPGHSLGQSGISACPLCLLVVRLTMLGCSPCAVAAPRAPTQQIQCRYRLKRTQYVGLCPHSGVRGNGRETQSNGSVPSVLQQALFLAHWQLAQVCCFGEGRRKFLLYYLAPAQAMSQHFKSPCQPLQEEGAMLARAGSRGRGPVRAEVTRPLGARLQQQRVAGPCLADIKRE